MSRAAQRSARRRSSRRWGGLLVGIGLIVLGLVAAIVLFGVDGGQALSWGAVERSVIPVAVEFPAPDLALADLNGQETALADLRGQVVLVNNWATWCPPCKEEMPALQAYYHQHSAQGFVLVAIEAGEPAEEVARFVQDYRLTFPVWLDPHNKALEAFGNLSLPSSYVIDRDGVVRYAWTGAITQEMLEKYITPLLED